MLPLGVPDFRVAQFNLENIMVSGHVEPHHGTPYDYSDTFYRVYFEVGEWQNIARDAINDFMVERSRAYRHWTHSPDDLHRCEHGYELDLPNQIIPELAQTLSARNLLVYQIVRSSISPR